MKTNSTKNIISINIESINNSQTIQEKFMVVLNAVESAILNDGRLHPMIGNPYQWFAAKLNYKAKNYFYHLFEQRLNHELKWKDIVAIYDITQDAHLKEVVHL